MCRDWYTDCANLLAKEARSRVSEDTHLQMWRAAQVDTDVLCKAEASRNVRIALMHTGRGNEHCRKHQANLAHSRTQSGNLHTPEAKTCDNHVNTRSRTCVGRRDGSS